jgi:hypothetical protein
MTSIAVSIHRRQLRIQYSIGLHIPRARNPIHTLDLSKIEALGESLLDFKSRSDLSRWLE